jgi:hypothetical protein
MTRYDVTVRWVAPHRAVVERRDGGGIVGEVHGGPRAGYTARRPGGTVVGKRHAKVIPAVVELGVAAAIYIENASTQARGDA